MYEERREQVVAAIWASGIRSERHGDDRLIRDILSLDTLAAALMSETSEVIEDYPEDVRGHSCLMLGWVESRPVHAVLTVTELPFLITAPPGRAPAPVEHRLPSEETAMSANTVRCPRCGGSMHLGETDYTYNDGDDIVVIHHVAALICEQCGNAAYEPDAYREVERIIRERPTPAYTVSASVYDLPRSGGRAAAAVRGRGE